MRGNLSILLLVLVAGGVLWVVLSRLHFVFFIPVSLGGLLLFVIGVIVVLYLVLDHFLGRSW